MALSHYRWDKNGRTLIDDSAPGRYVYKSGVGQQNVDIGGGQYRPYVVDLPNRTVYIADHRIVISATGLTLYAPGDLNLGTLRVRPEVLIGPTWTRRTTSLGSLSIREIATTDQTDLLELSYTLATTDSLAEIILRVGGHAHAHFSLALTNTGSSARQMRLTFETDRPGLATERRWRSGRTGPDEEVIGLAWDTMRLDWLREEAADHPVEHTTISRVLAKQGPFSAGERKAWSPTTWGPTGVAATGDDGHEYPENTWIGEIAWFGHYGSSNEWLATRFQNVTVPKDANVSSATYTITEYQDEGGTYTVNTKVRAQLIADSAAPGAANLPSDWTYTLAGVDFDVSSDNWTNNETDDITITAVIQEIVNQTSPTPWASGNDLTVVILNDGSTGDKDMGIYDYTVSSTKAAKLTIVYTTTAADLTISVSECGDGSTNLA